jgi:lipid-A-disaccharide synthase
MIVTGESSGELYGALLAAELKGRWPEARVLGVGGERMRKAGVEVFAGVAGALGLIEVLSAHRQIREAFAKTVAMLKKDPPDVVVLVDYPDFNFGVAREAGKLGIRVLYYVSPQVWAWRRGRIKTMARIAERIAVVLPFEVDIYRASGLPCEFVGHPIMDDMAGYPPDKESAKEALGLDGKPYVALLPGSRDTELKRLLPVLVDVAGEIRKRYPDFGIVMPLAPNIETSKYQGYFDELRKNGVTVTVENAVLALRTSEAAVIASGTATLQAAFLETPMVVIYKITPFTYIIGRIVVDVDYMTLANIILGREAVPELMQGRVNPGEIMAGLVPLLSDGDRREEMLRDLREVKGHFDGLKPSSRVAGIVGEMAGWPA